jgi:hypothetical protein
MGTLVKAIFGLVGLFFLAVLGLQLFGGLLMAKTAWTVSESMKPETAANPFGNDVELTGIYAGDMQKPGYLSLASFNDFHQYRTVRVETIVTAKSLLAPGETMPEPDFLEVFATARASKVADTECALLKQVIAKDCRVSHFSANITASRKVSISMNLEFTQKTAFGDFKRTGKAAYQDIPKSLTSEKTALKSGIEGQISMRGKLYASAESFCNKLRKSQGNCAISDMSIRVNEDSKSENQVVFRAQMTAAVVSAL